MEPQVKRALLVEPDYLQAEAAAANLEAAGFVVYEKTSAVDASILLLEQQDRFDIALVKFPYQIDQRRDTEDLLDILRDLSMPRVVVSEVSKEELEVLCPLQKGEGYIQIPYREQTLRKVIAKALNER